MKEKYIFLIVLGYILSFLVIKDRIFLVINLALLIILIIKKQKYMYYLLGIINYNNLFVMILKILILFPLYR